LIIPDKFNTAISALSDSNVRLLTESEVLWRIVGIILESHPQKIELASAIRESANNMLELWDGQSPEVLAHLTACVNRALEACGQSSGESS
jgi:hypothetical protein